MKPSLQVTVRGGWIHLRSLLVNRSKLDKISKFVKSFTVGMNVNPLLNTSFSDTLRLWSERLSMKFSAQVTQFFYFTSVNRTVTYNILSSGNSSSRFGCQ